MSGPLALFKENPSILPGHGSVGPRNLRSHGLSMTLAGREGRRRPALPNAFMIQSRCLHPRFLTCLYSQCLCLSFQHLPTLQLEDLTKAALPQEGLDPTHRLQGRTVDHSLENQQLPLLVFACTSGQGLAPLVKV